MTASGVTMYNDINLTYQEGSWKNGFYVLLLVYRVWNSIDFDVCFILPVSNECTKSLLPYRKNVCIAYGRQSIGKESG